MWYEGGSNSWSDSAREVIIAALGRKMKRPRRIIIMMMRGTQRPCIMRLALWQPWGYCLPHQSKVDFPLLKNILLVKEA